MSQKIVSKTNPAYRNNYNRIFNKPDIINGMAIWYTSCSCVGAQYRLDAIGNPRRRQIKSGNIWIDDPATSGEFPFFNTWVCSACGRRIWPEAIFDETGKLKDGFQPAEHSPIRNPELAILRDNTAREIAEYVENGLRVACTKYIGHRSEPHQVSEPINDGKVVVLSAKEYEHGSSRRRFILSCRHAPWLPPETEVGSRIKCPLCHVEQVVDLHRREDHEHMAKEYPIAFELSCGHRKLGNPGDHTIHEWVTCEYCASDGFSEDSRPFGVTMTEVQGTMPPDPGMIAKLPDGRTVLLPNGTKLPEGTGIVFGVDWGTGPSKSFEITARRASDGSFVIEEMHEVVSSEAAEEPDPPISAEDFAALKELLKPPELLDESAHPYAEEVADGVVALGDDNGVKVLLPTEDYKAIREAGKIIGCPRCNESGKVTYPPTDHYGSEETRACELCKGAKKIELPRDGMAMVFLPHWGVQNNTREYSLSCGHRIRLSPELTFGDIVKCPECHTDSVNDETTAQQVLDEIGKWPDSQRLAFSAIFHGLAYEALKPGPSTGFLRRVLGDNKGAEEAIECAKRVSEPFRKGAAHFKRLTIEAMVKEGLPVYCPNCDEQLVMHQIGNIPTEICCNNCGATLGELLGEGEDNA